MEFCKALAKLELFAINRECTISAFLALNGILRQTYCIDTKEISDTSFFQFKVSCHTVVILNVYDILFYLSEYPRQHIVEMHTYIGSHTTAFAFIALRTMLKARRIFVRISPAWVVASKRRNSTVRL